MFKFIMAILLTCWSLQAIAVVYLEDSESVFPSNVQTFINDAVASECAQGNWLYSAYNEEIDGNTFIADLSVGEDYGGDTYIVVSTNSDGEIVLDELECPISRSEWD